VWAYKLEELLVKIRQIPRFKLRSWQHKAIETIMNEFLSPRPSPILLTLPCGYGKTVVGEGPMLLQAAMDDWSIARGLTYVLPLRALTTEHKLTFEEDISKFGKFFVHAFHGEELETSYFYADIAVSTFDVFIYAFARRSRAGYHLEFPAGTIASSYVVFDEAHMLQDKSLYSHHVLAKVVKILHEAGIPILIMTATMPTTIRNVLFQDLNYVMLPEKPDDFTDPVESYRGRLKDAYLEKRELAKILEDKEFLKKISEADRVLIVCNTVRKAINLYEKLHEYFSRRGKLVLLIHSRLRRAYRKKLEELLRNLLKRKGGNKAIKCTKCGHDTWFPIYVRKEGIEGVFCEECRSDYPEAQRVEGVIVITTQVLEAGLDVSSELLVTETAPMDSLIQRCGRCGRFPGEEGVAVIVRTDEPIPYPKVLIEDSWKTLNEYEGRLTEALTYFPKSIEMIEKSYRGFRAQEIPSGYRDYLRYLEGVGLTTFAVDNYTMRRLRARLRGFITVIVILEDETVGAWEVVNSKTKRRPYSVEGTIRLSYREILDALKTDPPILFKPTDLGDRSFTVDREYASKNKEWFIHHVDGEKYFIRFQPVSVYSPQRGIVEKAYAIQRLTKSRRERELLEEGTYLLNPRFYKISYGVEKGVYT